MSEALDSHLKFTTSGDGNWSVVSGASNEYYYDLDAVQSGSISDSNESCLQTIVDVASSETIKFYCESIGAIGGHHTYFR